MKRPAWIVISVITIVGGVLLLTRRSTSPAELRVGALLPLTGDAAAYGRSAKNGLDLAVSEANAAGGIAGNPVRIIYEDTQADPKSGVSAFLKLVDVDQVRAVLGPMGSSVALAVAPIANEKRVVLLSATASAPTLTEAGAYFFRNVASDAYDGAAMAAFCRRELNLSKAAVIYVQNDFGLGLKDSFVRAFSSLGGDVVATEAFEQGAVDFRAQVTKVKAAKPECIFVVGYKEMGRLLRQCQELDLRPQYLSFSMFEDPEVVEQAGPLAEGVYYTFRSYDPSQKEGPVKGFVAAYTSAHGGPPDIFAALSYDAARILLSAIDEAGGLDSDQLRAALERTRDFPGVTGQTSFDENGDVVKPMGIKRVKGKAFVWVERTFSFGGEQQ